MRGVVPNTRLIVRGTSAATLAAAAILAAADAGAAGAEAPAPAFAFAAVALGIVLLLLARLVWRTDRAPGTLMLACAALSVGAFSCCAPLTFGSPAHRLGAVAHATLVGLAHASSVPVELETSWVLVADVLVAGALAVWLVVRRPAPAAAGGETRHHDLSAARQLVDRHGEDSLAPFIVRPDKTFAFAAGGVLAYRRFGRTAVVSGDPVAPSGGAGAVLESFLRVSRSRGWNVAVYGAGAHHIDAYRELGLRVLCVGEEAVVRPERFSLEGRAVRKLRQSVHRVSRRGWQIEAREGVEIEARTEAEMDALEAAWRAKQRRLIGFAMGMGRFEGGIAPSDLYVLARAPDGRLGAVMRFIAHRGRLSLDTMRRVGETPNGLNEALVCRALEFARERGVCEVSLNYAGLAHVIRRGPTGSWLRRRATALALAVLARRFQMQSLVRFNEKFAPEWRPRYLVYESQRTLPAAVLRVLQAEGYLPAGAREPSAPARSQRPDAVFDAIKVSVVER